MSSIHGSPIDEIVKEMEESAALLERMEAAAVPYSKEIRDVLTQLNGMSEGVSRIVERWKAEYLASSKAHDKSNPHGQDYEDYSKSIIVPTEMIRLSGFSELAHRLYRSVVRLADQHCQPPGPDLHRGALYAISESLILSKGTLNLASRGYSPQPKKTPDSIGFPTSLTVMRCLSKASTDNG